MNSARSQKSHIFEAGILVKLGILEAHVILKLGAIEENRLMECGSTEAGMPKSGVRKVCIGKEARFVEASVAKSCTPKNDLLLKIQSIEGGVGYCAIDKL